MVTSGSWCFSIRTILTGCSLTTVVSAVAIATARSGYSLLTTLSWADIRDCMCVREEGESVREEGESVREEGECVREEGESVREEGGVCEGGGDSV